MLRKKRGYVIIIVSIILMIIALGVVYILRDEQRKNFNKLLNSNAILKVDYGIIPQEKALKEKNNLFRRVYLDNYYYLVINDENTIFTYYLDWYYAFDPMQGYHLDYKKELSKETVNNILNSIRTKTIDSLQARIKDDYISVRIDNKNTYIDKTELQYILQDNDIMIDISKIKIY